MPEFVMEGRDHAARLETPFVLGFIEAMFFTTTDTELPGDVGYTDLAPDTLRGIQVYCADWQDDHNALLVEAYAHPSGYEEVQAGRDLWYTMNGHGVGFWDRGLGDVGDLLSEEARYNEVTPFFQDNLVHLEI
jgi:hypothetical protein